MLNESLTNVVLLQNDPSFSVFEGRETSYDDLCVAITAKVEVLCPNGALEAGDVDSGVQDPTNCDPLVVGQLIKQLLMTPLIE
jgi:hypothetical protein